MPAYRVRPARGQGIVMMSQIASRLQALKNRLRALRRGGGAGSTGFTLIEVVVALAVVAISLTAIGAVTATSARGTRSLEQHLALVETTRIVAATLPRSSKENAQANPQSLDGL